MFKIIPTLKYEDTLAGDICKRSSYLERVVGSDTLLITVGDSWTWGDSLGNINIDVDDLSKTICDNVTYRERHVYGNYIQKHLNCDWINYGWCGFCNVHIFSLLDEYILPFLSQYKKVLVIGVLTETARHCRTEHTPNIKFSSVADYLEQYENMEFLHIKNILNKYNNVEFLIARNFTYSFDSNKDIFRENYIERSWVDIIANHINDKTYPNDLRFMTDMVTTPLNNTLESFGKLSRSKSELVNFYDKSLAAIHWLHMSPLNYKKATKHPTERAHKIWADYLISVLK